MMTKQHVEAIAECFRIAFALNAERSPYVRAIVVEVLELASALACANPNFDRERFLRACRSDGEVL